MNTTSIISLDLGWKNTGFFSCTTHDFNNLKKFSIRELLFMMKKFIFISARRGKRLL